MILNRILLKPKPICHHFKKGPHLVELVSQVGFEDADQLEEKLKHHRDIRVQSCHSYEVQPLVPGVCKGSILKEDDRRSGSGGF